MIHTCIEAHIEDKLGMTVDIHPQHCGGDVECCTTDCPCSSVSIEDRDETIITMEWVCGAGFSERYLCSCDNELITIDGNYLVVKYKPKQ